jgi:hypothetical protein
MTAAIFLVLFLAMLAAWRGHRRAGMALFGAAFALALVWFVHHMTDPVALAF